MRVPRLLTLALGASALLSFSLVACGDDEGVDEVDLDEGSPIVTVSTGTPGVTPPANPTNVTGDQVTVEVGDNFFEPADIEIESGTTVTWEWTGQNEHSVFVEYRGDEVLSDVQSEGTYEFTFDEAGEYEYHCTVHGPEVMSGNIIVTSSDEDREGSAGGTSNGNSDDESSPGSGDNDGTDTPQAGGR